MPVSASRESIKVGQCELSSGMNGDFGLWLLQQTSPFEVFGYIKPLRPMRHINDLDCFTERLDLQDFWINFVFDYSAFYFSKLVDKDVDVSFVQPTVQNLLKMLSFLYCVMKKMIKSWQLRCWEHYRFGLFCHKKIDCWSSY